MGRPSRNYQSGSYHHLVNRGVAKCATYLDDEDYAEFIKLLQIGCYKYRMDVIAYALMPNHYHILIQAVQNGNISKCMHWINGNYAKYFNKRYERVGHLWQDRYFAKEINAGRQLGTVWRYVEQNACRAKLVSSPELWPWTSAYIRANNMTVSHLIEPSWWGSAIMKEWWSDELLDQATIDKIRRSVQRPSAIKPDDSWD